MSDDNENSRHDSLNSETVTEEVTSHSIIETEELRETNSQKELHSSFRLGKTLLGLGVFALLTGNILVLTNHLKPSSSMAEMSGMDHGDMSHDEMMAVDGSFNPNPVRVETVEPQVLEASVSYTGTIEPYQEIVVYPRVAGQLTNYSVYPGDRVTAGQAIATLDASELNTGVAEAVAEANTMETALEMSKIEVDEQRSAIAQIEADLAYLNLKQDRFARLVKDGVISQDEFDVVDSEVKSKEAALKQARVRLVRMEAQVVNDRAKINQAKAKVDTANVMQGYTTITSPISGIVQERSVDPGVVVQPSMGIVKIGDYNRVRLQANVAQQDAVNIRPGSPVLATIPGSNVEPIKGKITSIFPQANSQTRTVTVEAVIDNPDGQLLSGKFLEMKIVTARKPSAITIPQAAVVEFQDQPSVWVVEGDTVTAQPVTLGMSTGDRVEVTSGLKRGEAVVTSGQRRLVENATVAVINQSSQPIAANKASAQDIQIQLVSPDSQTGVPMGDAQLVIEVKDAQGQPLDILDLEMSASMPMKNMAPMTAPVEVQPDGKPGRFKADTYLSMKGDWTITAQVKDPKNKGKQEFTLEVQ
ncbi:Efflux transporter, RND family, MFP subunit [Hyella patelloides LEGE 07179]|uniref:Efflux transporter, RND family, MFP subunit n=2 Tax=Hyella TaxID=945733 RepID=A0A563VT15_9CYAN|nr:efflux RND transporter periplasmic adaptor subunit [Hyella patelloides]VEP14612.1 Efflux transporter, RND family, MFP subunit [Hyella patelloides LEGE 07179]